MQTSQEIEERQIETKNFKVQKISKNNEGGHLFIIKCGLLHF